MIGRERLLNPFNGPTKAFSIHFYVDFTVGKRIGAALPPQLGTIGLQGQSAREGTVINIADETEVAGKRVRRLVRVTGAKEIEVGVDGGCQVVGPRVFIVDVRLLAWRMELAQVRVEAICGEMA